MIWVLLAVAVALVLVGFAIRRGLVIFDSDRRNRRPHAGIARHSKACVDANFTHHAATGGDLECTCREGHPDDAPSPREIAEARLYRLKGSSNRG